MVSLIKGTHEYKINVTLYEKSYKNKIKFLSDIMELEKTGNIKIERTIYGIDNIRLILHTSEINKGEYDLIKILKEYSSKYGKITVSVNNNLYHDCTLYDFKTGRMMEKEYFSNFA